MVGTVRLIWKKGVLTDKGKEVAGPGDSIIVDSATAERFIAEGKAGPKKR